MFGTALSDPDVRNGDMSLVSIFSCSWGQPMHVMQQQRRGVYAAATYTSIRQDKVHLCRSLSPAEQASASKDVKAAHPCSCKRSRIRAGEMRRGGTCARGRWLARWEMARGDSAGVGSRLDVFALFGNMVSKVDKAQISVWKWQSRGEQGPIRDELPPSNPNYPPDSRPSDLHSDAPHQPKPQYAKSRCSLRDIPQPPSPTPYLEPCTARPNGEIMIIIFQLRRCEPDKKQVSRECYRKCARSSYENAQRTANLRDKSVNQESDYCPCLYPPTSGRWKMRSSLLQRQGTRLQCGNSRAGAGPRRYRRLQEWLAIVVEPSEPSVVEPSTTSTVVALMRMQVPSSKCTTFDA
ncbi:hypothetical protein BKA63DRAFT_486915 [Paraphoma chrysanthemicola]|nr:hypothetical protein BKA63DRAFT_486915 [Paraphoma chrysanthemicola]